MDLLLPLARALQWRADRMERSIDEEIYAAADALDGQLLTKVEADPNKGTSSFSFDQGALLQTWTYNDDDNDEQWMLYMKSGDVFSYRADGCYSLGAGDQRDDAVIWQPLGRPG